METTMRLEKGIRQVDFYFALFIITFSVHDNANF